MEDKEVNAGNINYTPDQGRFPLERLKGYSLLGSSVTLEILTLRWIGSTQELLIKDSSKTLPHTDFENQLDTNMYCSKDEQ